MANVHPTVKPIALCRWLVRLVTPSGGIVLDPFAGSGSVGCASAADGFRFIGIDQSEEYCVIARRRIAYWARQPAPAVPSNEVLARAARRKVRDLRTFGDP